MVADETAETQTLFAVSLRGLWLRASGHRGNGGNWISLRSFPSWCFVGKPAVIEETAETGTLSAVSLRALLL